MALDLPAWVNKPSTATPVNAANLGKVNTALNAIDGRVATLESAGAYTDEAAQDAVAAMIAAGTHSGITFAYDDATNRLSATVPPTITANTQTASYTLVVADAGKAVEMNVAGANTVTIPPNASAPFLIGTVIEIFQMGAGQTTVTAGTGVTLRAPDGAKTSKQYASASIRKRAADEWVIAGSTTT